MLKWENKIDSLGHKVLDNAVVAGISGGLLAECSLLPSFNDGGSSPDFCLILAPTCSLYPDVWSSVMIIQLLNSLLNTTSRYKQFGSFCEKTRSQSQCTDQYP
jgi:predicted ATP-grasp superfamily ATP-dependent carboligase